jgi:hypothetical protein
MPVDVEDLAMLRSALDDRIDDGGQHDRGHTLDIERPH